MKVVDSQFGPILADGRGQAFYFFDKETTTKPRCYGACAEAWPPVYAKGRPVAGKGARKGLIGVTKRRDGRRQVTYNGRPLYYYVADRPGLVLCHDVRGVRRPVGGHQGPTAPRAVSVRQGSPAVGSP